MPFFAFIWGFTTFMPYPAVAVGNNVGIQISQIFAVILLAVEHRQIKSRHLVIWLMLLFSGFTSLLMAALSSWSANISVGLLNLIALASYSITIVITSIFLPNYTKNMILGIAAATLVHAVIGGYQVISFQGNTFPFEWFYKNPSFATPEVDAIARHTKRPFGLFPEPSAAAASIGPWLIFFAASTLKYLRIAWSSGEDYLIGTAMVGGLVLILMSQTGMVFIIFPCILFLFVRKASQTQTPGLIFVSFLMLVVCVCLGIYFISGLVENRLLRFSAADSGGSWYSRLDSIMIGLDNLFSSAHTFFWGIGPGQGGSMMSQQSDYPAIWSVFFNSIVENGFLVMVAWGSIITYSIKAIIRCQERITGVLFFIVWFSAIAIATSYTALLPVWVSLGVLLTWNNNGIGCSDRREKNIG